MYENIRVPPPPPPRGLSIPIHQTRNKKTYCGKNVLYVMFYCVFVTFPCGVLGQVCT